MSFKTYAGVPYFALDVTPKGTIEDEAKGVIAEMEAKGFTFNTGRTVMSLSAEEGMDISIVELNQGYILAPMQLRSRHMSTPFFPNNPC